MTQGPTGYFLVEAAVMDLNDRLKFFIRRINLKRRVSSGGWSRSAEFSALYSFRQMHLTVEPETLMSQAS
ncbi:hypothetical protein WJ35_05980 [Burkholderia ubonensis]|uniref:Uncharacterized protein n=1 Tax=Burkholderia ubonensis TaxID=101571 RepID=A0A1B4LBU5_9BURK|nr:hypothetical protein WJ35_05980 [Burkholderia ubonensis]AOK09739.1 hypothetical protein WK31_05520 [Burkholderia vietnamiensis]